MTIWLCDPVIEAFLCGYILVELMVQLLRGIVCSKFFVLSFYVFFVALCARSFFNFVILCFSNDSLMYSLVFFSLR